MLPHNPFRLPGKGLAVPSWECVLLGLCLLLVSTAVQSQEIIAHRGYWNIDGSVENSIDALMKADSIKAYGSEVDIWLSSDGIPVVNHDADVTLDGEKRVVQDTPFATLRKVILANGEPLPTVEEYLDAFAQCSHTKLIIELKPHRTREQEDELATKVIDMVNAKGLADKVEYISFSLHLVQQTRKIAPNAPVYYLSGDLTPEALSAMKATGPDYNLNVFLKNPTWVKEAHELGQKVNVWTVNRPEDIQKMIDLKVDYITTDEPLLVREMLDKQ